MKSSIGTLVLLLAFSVSQIACSADSPQKKRNPDHLGDTQAKVNVISKDSQTHDSNGGHGWVRSDDKMLAYLDRQQRKPKESLITTISCDACYVFVKLAREFVQSGKTQEVVMAALVEFCILFRIQDKRVCKMVAQEYQDEIFYLARYLSLEPWQACGIALGVACQGHHYPGEPWSVSFPPTPKPQPRPPTPPQPSSPILRVLHLTDIHLDFQYTEGARVECGEPLCCRDNQMNTSSLFGFFQKEEEEEEERAGRYGHYGNCDVPSETLLSLFQHLRDNEQKFDYILFTGDVPAHDIWNQSRSDQLRHIHLLDQLFQTYLPGVPVYWTIGNHEAAPCNSFVIPGLPGRNMSWLYDPLAEMWARWLPREALSTVRSCGGFSVSPYTGFRIISLNNNYCNKDNYWLLLNTTDPCGTLQWLITELQKAEDNKEKVHLLMHIPPGDHGCLKVWSHNFYDIINRYENTVVNQFYGHNHRDWFEMFYDTRDFRRPLNFGFVTPAVTSRDKTNPVYRVYTVDGNYPGSSWAVLDYTNYFLNLTEANLLEKATWTYAYNPKVDLDMTGLYAADYEDLIQRMEKDDALFQKFYYYYYNLHLDEQEPCDADCKADVLCSLKEGRSYDPDLCNIHS